MADVHLEPWAEDDLSLLRNLMGDAEMTKALRYLSPREREAIYLRFFQDAAYEEVAGIMRISASTCRVLVHRALDKLRTHLTTPSDQKRETL